MELKFRFAEPSDVDLYFKWVNETAVRQNSFNEKVILYDDHVRWFSSRLLSEKSFLYLFMNADNIPVGQVRIEQNGETIIDVSIDEKFRGLSISAMLLRQACRDFLAKFKNETIFAYIKKSNAASYKTFLKAGFREIGTKEDQFYKLKIGSGDLIQKITTLHNKGTTFDIFRSDNGNVENVKAYFKLFYACFGFREHLDRSWFSWSYESNPYGSCNNYILEDKTENVYAGAYAYSKSKMVLNGKKIIVGIGVNGMMHSEYRNRGLYSELISVTAKADDTQGAVAYAHGANRGSVKGHINAGWRVLKKIYFYANSDLKTFKEEPQVREVNSFSELNSPDLFVPKNYASFMEKDPVWMDWRFFQRPHKKYTSMVYFNEAGLPLGYIVLAYYRSAAASRCQIADYNASDPAVLSALLNGAKKAAVNNDCNVLDLWVDDQSKELDFFRSRDFKKTEEFHEMLVFEKEGLIFDSNIKTVLADLDAI